MNNDARNIFVSNLKYYMTTKNKTQSDISKALHIPLSTISSWYNGASYPRVDKMQALADYFNISMRNLTDKQNNDLIPSNIINIPLYKPAETILDLFRQHKEYSHCALPVDKLNSNREYFGTIARFDNNIDVGIRKDDYLIFEKTDTLKNGQLGCYVYNDYFYIGRYYQYGQDIIVVFASEKYQPIYANEISHFQVLGRLCTVITSYEEE